MSLAVAGPAALAAAFAYGAATAVQHDAAHTGSGEASAGRLVQLVRDPRWLMSVGGDAVGLVLQVIALATGPVVLVQPLLVLSVAVALPVGVLLGGPRPSRGDVLAGLAVIAALAVFFALIGDPGSGDLLRPRVAAMTAAIALIVGAVGCAAVHGQPPPVRAVAFGAAAGSGFGVVGVLLNATADVVNRDGWGVLRHPAGSVPLLSVVVVGVAAVVLTQVSFQIGALSASFPANEVAAPLVAVVLGAALLHEHVPLSPVLAVSYALCLGVVIVGTIRLAVGPRPARQ
jgi:hypothetical protein